MSEQILNAADRAWLIRQFEIHTPVRKQLWAGPMGRAEPGSFECGCGQRRTAVAVGSDALEEAWNQHIEDEWQLVEDFILRAVIDWNGWCEGSPRPHRFSNEKRPDKCDSCESSDE